MASTEKLVVELEAKLGNSTKSIADFEKSLDKAESSATGLESSVSAMTKASSESVSAIKSLTAQSTKLNSSIGVLNSSLIDSRAATKSAKEEVDRYAKQLKEAEESGEATSEEIERLTNSLSKSRTELSRNQKTTNDLSTKLRSAKSDYSAIQTEIKATTKDLSNLDKESNDTSLSIGSLSGSIKKGSLAIAGAVTAFTAFVTITAKSRKELQLLSAQTGLATGDFESLAFAAQSYGVTAEQVADISKDLADKIGEFATVGTGAFQDVADVLGLTEAQALSFAQSLQGLTSKEVIQEISNQLESVNATAEQTTFVFESLGNDLSRLSPLFAENGRELDTLTSRYNKANAELAITAAQEKDLAALADTSKLLTDQLGNAATLISASFAPIFNDFFNAVIDIVPEATNTLVDFFNTFQNAENISSINSLDREIEELTKRSADYEEQLQSLLGGEYITTDLDDNIREQADGLSIVNQRLFELEQQREKLIEQQDRFSKVNEGVGGDFSTGDFTPSAATQRDTTEDNASELALIEERFKSEELLLEEKLLREQEIIGNNHDLQVELYSEYLDNLNALDQKRLSSVEKDKQAEAKATKKSNDDKLSSELAYADAAINIGNLLFEDNKALRLGLVVADTAAGITRAFADLPYPAALAASVSIAATGAAQLSAINSASKGGGSSVSAPSATSVDTSLPEETPELSVSASDTSGSNQSIPMNSHRR